MAECDALCGDDGLRVLLADQSPLYREGVKLALNCSGTGCVEVSHFDAIAAELTEAGQIDLLVLDSRLPGFASLSHLKQLLDGVEIPVLLTTDRTHDQGFNDVMSAGVRGVVSKTVGLETLSHAIGSLLKGHYWFQGPRFNDQCKPPNSLALKSLSQKELAVLNLLKDGLSNRQISIELDACESTVKRRVSTLYRKTDIRNRARLALAARALPTASLEQLRVAIKFDA